MSTLLQMPINDNQLSQIIADRLVDQMKSIVIETVKSMSDEIKNNDETFNKKQLCKEVLHCDTKTFDEKIFTSDFPYLETEGNKLYSRKAVNNWIATHQTTLQGAYQWEQE